MKHVPDAYFEGTCLIKQALEFVLISVSKLKLIQSNLCMMN